MAVRHDNGNQIKSDEIEQPSQGDSGAPLIYEDSKRGSRVIALATFTPENGCSKGKPGVFTRLASYLDWISSITNYDVEQ